MCKGNVAPDLLAEYNLTRKGTSDKKHICHAPYNNIYFNIEGQGAACWKSFGHAPSWQQESISKIWFGDYFIDLRQRISNGILTQECSTCLNNIISGNHMGALSQAYDNEHEILKYPRIMELELSNKCNCECIMCTGRLSSSIRVNREKSTLLPDPYDARFVEELCEFLPYLAELRVNGGEPFLHGILYDILDNIACINPQIEITIATNGTILNDRVKEALKRCKMRINISIDSLEKDNYEIIRKNASFEQVMENVKFFASYCRNNDRIFSVMINPMRQNWWEMGNFVEWCNRNSYHLWFNTVEEPKECSLIHWEYDRLDEVYDKLSESRDFFVAGSGDDRYIHMSNIEKYNNLVENMVRVWRDNAKKKGA